MRFAEQAVVQPHFAQVGVPGRNPMDIALHLVAVRARRARFAFGEIIAVHGEDLARIVLVAAAAFDDEAVAQPHLVSRIEPEVTLGRDFHEILALYPQFARKRQRALAQFRLLRMVGREAFLCRALGIIVDDEFERIEHGDAPRRNFVQMLAHTLLEHAIVDPGVGLGHADALGEQAKALGRVAAPARRHQRRQARIVPALDMFFRDQLDQLALGQHDIAEVEPREFELLRQGAREQSAFGQARQQPVVERALVLEFQRADGMGDLLQRILDWMGVGVHRVDAPRIAAAMVRRPPDAVDRRVAQVDVGRAHVDFRAQHHAALGVPAGAHFAQARERLGGRALAPGTVDAVLGQRAARGAQFLGALFVHVGVARTDQVFRRLVHGIEIVARVVQVLGAVGAPVKAEPAHRIEYRIDVLLFFLLRIGIVEAHVADAAVVAREAEVEADRLGVAEVQVAVGLGRKARADFRRIGRRAGVRRSEARAPAPGACGVFAARQVGVDDVANEVGDVRGGRAGGLIHDFDSAWRYACAILPHCRPTAHYSAAGRQRFPGERRKLLRHAARARSLSMGPLFRASPARRAAVATGPPSV